MVEETVILFIDENKKSTKIKEIRDILSEYGIIDIYIEDSIESTLDFLRHENVDIVVSSILVPMKEKKVLFNPIKSLTDFRENNEGEHFKIILHSGMQEVEDSELVDEILKPVDQKKLIDLILKVANEKVAR